MFGKRDHMRMGFLADKLTGKEADDTGNCD